MSVEKRPSMKQLREERRIAKEEAQRQEVMGRRAFLAKFIGAGVAFGGAVIGVGTMRREDASAPKPSAPFTPDIKKLEQMYVELEAKATNVHERTVQGMQRLEQQVRPYLDTLPPDSRAFLEFPFEQVRVNEQNPNWNRYSVMLEDVRSRGEEVLGSARGFTQADIRYFMYAVGDKTLESTGFVASFEATSRSLILSEHLEAESLIDDLVIYHELVHAGQDVQIRMTLNSEEDQQAFLAFMDPMSELNPGEKARINGLLETDAYMAELSLLNALTKGSLAKDVSDGAVNPDDYIERLAAKSDTDRRTVMFLIDMAKVYFKGGIVSEENIQSLQKAVEETYRQRGATIYNWRSIEDLKKIIANPEKYRS